MPVDILQTDISWHGRDVYIVGSGPNGKGHYSGLKSPVIAINKAIEAVTCRAYWLCLAPGLISESYFHHMIGDCIFDKFDGHLPILSKALCRNYPEAPYTFTEGQHLAASDVGIRAGVLRRGAGTVGCALQLAQQLGAVRCILCGCDMKGLDYFDGTVNEAKRSINPDGSWTQIAMLQQLVDEIKRQGCDVVSMTETLLNVELI